MKLGRMNLHLRFWSMLAILVVACLVIQASPEGQRTVTILYSNDFHAAMEPMTATWLVDQPHIGGARAFAGWIHMLRTTQPNVFLFDSGDLYTGQAISFLTRGQALIDIWKAIGFDAVCYGNHEFDYGLEPAMNYAKQEPFPVLAANLFYKSNGQAFAKPYALLEKNGVKIAVIGIFGTDAASATTRATWDTLEVRDPIPILQRLVPELRRQVDLVVVLAHQGETGPMQSDAEAHPEVQRDFEADKMTVARVPSIDVFIGGHAHRGIEVPWVSPTTGSIVVQTYGRGTTIGVLKLTQDIASHRIVAHEGALVRTMDGVFPPPASVDAVVKKWEDEGARAGKEVVGEAATPLTRNYNGESAVGDLVTDAMVWKGGAQIAFVNAGGIRGDLPMGPLTRYDAISAYPFMNTATEMELTGKDIRSALEQSLTLKTGMLQLSGMRVTYDLSKPEYQRVVSAQVGSDPLDDGRTYKIVASSFVALGGDHYETFLNGKNVHDTGELLCDVFTEYARKMGRLSAPPQNRLMAQTK